MPAALGTYRVHVLASRVEYVPRTWAGSYLLNRICVKCCYSVLKLQKESLCLRMTLTALVPPDTPLRAPADEKSAHLNRRQQHALGKARRVLLAACSRATPASAFPCARIPLAVHTPLTPRTAIRAGASHAVSG